MKKIFTKNRIIAGAIVLIAIVSLVNTQAINKISKVIDGQSQVAASLRSVRIKCNGGGTVTVTDVPPTVILNDSYWCNKGGGSWNELGPVTTKSDVFGLEKNNTRDIDDYIKEKYPRDYQKKLNSITSNVNKLININVNKDDPEEIRRFLCWITGGTWVQIGPARSCIYPNSFEMIALDSGNFMNDIFLSFINQNKVQQENYFNQKNINKEKSISSLNKIFIEDVGVQPESINIRKFLCRMFGGTWEEGTTTASDISGVPNSYSINYSICNY